MNFLRKLFRALFQRGSARSVDKSAYCSFCRKSYSEVGPFVEGPDRVFICYACIQLGLNLLQEESERLGKSWPPSPRETKSDLDRPPVDATRNQIRLMVSEIEQLATANISANKFYSEFLKRVVTALAAIGGVVWLQADDGTLAPLSILDDDEIGIDRTHLINRGPALAKIFASGENRLIQPDLPIVDKSGNKDAELNPTDYLLIVAMLHAGKRRIGLLEIFQRAGGRTVVERGYMRFVLQMCETAEKFNTARGL